MRTVSLNAHYLVLFKNPRDTTQIHTLASQMFPGNSALLLTAFKDATATPVGGSDARGYLALDFHPTTCDALRILTNIFEEHPVAYVPHEYINEPFPGTATEPVADLVHGFSTSLSSNRRTKGANSASSPTRGSSQAGQKARQRSRKANGKVPVRVLEPASISGGAKGRKRRRYQGDLQRCAQR